MFFNRKPFRIFYGWWVVTGCFLIALYIGGVVYYGFTAVFEPIASEFGWSYAQVSIAASLRGLETGLLAPIIGLLVDRWGPRKLMFFGVTVVGIGLMLLSGVSSLVTFYAVFFLIAIGTSNCSSTVKNTAVANWFRSKVGIATGIVASGWAFGGLLVPLVTTYVDTMGWRTAMVIFGLGMLVIGLPLSLLVRHKPEQYGYLPDGRVENPAGADERPETVVSTEVDIQVKQFLKSRPFWHIAISLMYQMLVTGAVITHVMPYFSSIGVARSTSSFAASAIPVASVGGRIGFGWLGDKFDKRHVSATGFILMILGLIFFALIPSQGIWMFIPFLILFGTGWGANITMRPALLREYFGSSKFGTVHGFTIGVMMIGNMAGAPLAGWAFDNWGSYHYIWFIFAGMGLVALLTMLTTPSSDSLIRPAAGPTAQDEAF
jgi:sugar phosphate permease